ncbi:unnamed protein product [Meloidogyne enterolobii]|uniref:Uncharacterized protein n=1 Tax=Meloidogyne enterolobii TaxID=390850 RepID=A0ACB1AEI7_MELEN
MASVDLIVRPTNLNLFKGSVMHYGPYGFASDQYKPTISTLDINWQSTIGQRIGPSFLDILFNSIQFNSIYTHKT